MTSQSNKRNLEDSIFGWLFGLSLARLVVRRDSTDKNKHTRPDHTGAYWTTLFCTVHCTKYISSTGGLPITFNRSLLVACFYILLSSETSNCTKQYHKHVLITKLYSSLYTVLYTLLYTALYCRIDCTYTSK